MTVIADLLERVGPTGLPANVDSSVQDTWNVYHPDETPESPEDRILSVLGFFYLLRQSGLKRYIKGGTSDPAAIYKDVRQEEFDAEAKLIARLLVRYRVFDVLRTYKTKFSMGSALRGNLRVLRVDLCFEPKRNEPLDSALAKLAGMLYKGELPKPLREQWKKLPIKSTAKHKSALQPYTRIMANDSAIGWEPLDLGKQTSVYARRTAGDMFVLRIVTNTTAKPVPWLRARPLDDLIKSIFSKAFSKLKG